ncbi:hypothetical protein TBLA_0C03760 [Henningerozyma blattae CBS 6284]|uniref:Arrestin-like N-terminal domain-containing protein n=1 Tax=Henningerozyma blattae (strain ATCC 34711 / CBS 6284 / DSM 70876 / NBRC 10599 / NRRL Y-10934 / UCD 77-7) TaxID=1071380 RepID=I2H1C6_HENB6|nr:hypothetical protein TBLA_0C03760 [Tetrapisispora blattae CBS 6284]CCH60178.1 hypothetical protein TBLA_0C03760 [Tetrapisispora blattae CBS 6284]
MKTSPLFNTALWRYSNSKKNNSAATLHLMNEASTSQESSNKLKKKQNIFENLPSYEVTTSEEKKIIKLKNLKFEGTLLRNYHESLEYLYDSLNIEENPFQNFCHNNKDGYSIELVVPEMNKKIYIPTLPVHKEQEFGYNHEFNTIDLGKNYVDPEISNSSPISISGKVKISLVRDYPIKINCIIVSLKCFSNEFGHYVKENSKNQKGTVRLLDSTTTSNKYSEPFPDFSYQLQKCTPKKTIQIFLLKRPLSLGISKSSVFEYPFNFNIDFLNDEFSGSYKNTYGTCNYRLECKVVLENSTSSLKNQYQTKNFFSLNKRTSFSNLNSHTDLVLLSQEICFKKVLPSSCTLENESIRTMGQWCRRKRLGDFTYNYNDDFDLLMDKNDSELDEQDKFKFDYALNIDKKMVQLGDCENPWNIEFLIEKNILVKEKLKISNMQTVLLQEVRIPSFIYKKKNKKQQKLHSNEYIYKQKDEPFVKQSELLLDHTSLEYIMDKHEGKIKHILCKTPICIEDVSSEEFWNPSPSDEAKDSFLESNTSASDIFSNNSPFQSQLSNLSSLRSNSIHSQSMRKMRQSSLRYPKDNDKIQVQKNNIYHSNTNELFHYDFETNTSHTDDSYLKFHIPRLHLPNGKYDIQKTDKELRRLEEMIYGYSFKYWLQPFQIERSSIDAHRCKLKTIHVIGLKVKFERILEPDEIEKIKECENKRKLLLKNYPELKGNVQDKAKIFYTICFRVPILVVDKEMVSTLRLPSYQSYHRDSIPN